MECITVSQVQAFWAADCMICAVRVAGTMLHEICMAFAAYLVLYTARGLEDFVSSTSLEISSDHRTRTETTSAVACNTMGRQSHTLSHTQFCLLLWRSSNLWQVLWQSLTKSLQLFLLQILQQLWGLYQPLLYRVVRISNLLLHTHSLSTSLWEFYNMKVNMKQGKLSDLFEKNAPKSTLRMLWSNCYRTAGHAE